MPHPSDPSTAASELLEVAEAILHSVVLPPGVLDKYRHIQREVRSRSFAQRSDADGSQFAATAALGESDRALLTEKLNDQKRRNAHLTVQAQALEQQVAQLTNKISALHTHHKTALSDCIAQTKHACDAAHSRLLDEAEARVRLEGTLGRQVLEDNLAAERAFHSSVREKVESLAAMFPEIYSNVRTLEPAAKHSLVQPLDGGVNERSQLHNPNSDPRRQISAFFEATRAALNDARHNATEGSEARAEAAAARQAAQSAECISYAANKALQVAERRASEQRAALAPDGALRQERDAIFARVAAIEARMRTSDHSGAALSSATIAASSASPLSKQRASPARSAASEFSPRTRQPSVERGDESEEDERVEQAAAQLREERKYDDLNDSYSAEEAADTVTQLRSANSQRRSR